jgi:hypothetical protein
VTTPRIPPISYAVHGTARVAIIAIPEICGNRLVYLSQKGEYSWAIRDFITGRILRSGDSELTLSEIEALVRYSEKPVYRSVDRRKEWTAELVASSEREFGPKYDDAKPPSTNAGKWKAL